MPSLMKWSQYERKREIVLEISSRNVIYIHANTFGTNWSKMGHVRKTIPFSREDPCERKGEDDRVGTGQRSFAIPTPERDTVYETNMRQQ